MSTTTQWQPMGEALARGNSWQPLHVVIKYGAGISLLYVATLYLYRILFHPLSKYPGPVVAKVSDIWSGYYAYKQNLHLKAYETLLEYGPVVRTGPNRLVFRTAKAAHDIYTNDRLTKSEAYRWAADDPESPSIFEARDKAVHGFKRKVIGQAISERSMRLFEPEMDKQVGVFMQLLAESADKGQVLNMSLHIQRLAFDIVGLLAFGTELKTMTQETNWHILNAQTFGVYRANINMQFPFVPATGLPKVLEYLNAGAVQEYRTAMGDMIARRIAEGKHARHDLYSIAADQMNPKGDNSRDSELWAEAGFFLPAGADTVSTLMSAMLFYLAKNPRAYKRVAAEIRGTFKSGRDIKLGPTMNGCKYLRACVDETLRMTPPAAGMLWRVVDPKDKSGAPFVVDGHVLPAGTNVTVSTYSVLHDEDYFPRPFEYRPERWLDGEQGEAKTPEQRSAMLQAFIPFSLGSRSCAGKAMAYAESTLVMAKTLWYFDFELPDGPEAALGGGGPQMGPGRQRAEEFQTYDIFGAIHDGPKLLFRKRGDLCNELFQE